MRFDQAWGKIASENYILKVLIAGLFLLTILFGVSTLKLSTQGALIIERGCYSKALAISNDTRPISEVEAFLKEALRQRFATQADPLSTFLSAEELKARDTEQKEFKTRGMSQNLVFYSIKEKNGQFEVESDRVIRVGDVRSAFKFPISVKVESQKRTDGNPYGLILTKTDLIKTGEK